MVSTTLYIDISELLHSPSTPTHSTPVLENAAVGTRSSDVAEYTGLELAYEDGKSFRFWSAVKFGSTLWNHRCFLLEVPLGEQVEISTLLLFLMHIYRRVR